LDQALAFRAKRKPMQDSRGLALCMGSGVNHRRFSSRAEEKARDRPAARSLFVRDDQRRTHAADTANHLEGEAGGTLTSALDPVAHVSRYEKTVMAQEPRARTVRSGSRSVSATGTTHRGRHSRRRTRQPPDVRVRSEGTELNDLNVPVL
jgi:hypothetical protein